MLHLHRRRVRPAPRIAVSLLALLLAAVAYQGGGQAAVAAQPERCSVTLSRGAEIGAAVARASAGATICLGDGTYPPLSIRNDAPAGLTVRGVAGGAVIEARESVGVSVEARRLTLASLTVRGGEPAAVEARGATGLLLRDVRIERAEVGILIDGGDGRLEGVSVIGATTAAVVARDAEVEASRLLVQGGDGYGVAALAGARVAVRDSTLVDGAGPALFAGAPGCAELGLATPAVPLCFYDDLDAAIADARLTVERVDVGPGPGAGIVLHPGSVATVRSVTVGGRGMGGLLAWGARADIDNGRFDGNGAFGVAYWSYPDPTGETVMPASGQVRASTVRGTAPVGGPVQGDGIVARGEGVAVQVLAATLAENAGAGVVATDGASVTLRNSTIEGNEGPAICPEPDADALRTNTLLDNGRRTRDCAEAMLGR